MAETNTRQRRHPGKGQLKALAHLKGRQTDPTAIEEVSRIVGAAPLARDMLIEYLHAIQDQTGALSAAHLAALAKIMRLPLAEVYEVATFYHNFDVVKSDSERPPAVTIRVCDSLTCELMGADALIAALEKTYDDQPVRIKRAACMGRCHQAPVVRLKEHYITEATVKTVQTAVNKNATTPVLPAYQDIAAYRAAGGYTALGECLNGTRTADEVIAQLEESGLRGLGGAGFPTGRKWRFVRAAKGPRLMAVNGDESEPGTFKDYHFLARHPHKFLEGALIGAWAVEATDLYIYLRDEYPELREMLKREIAAARDDGLVRPKIHLRRGAGAYICGEESAMLESLEGKRGLPRHKPPFPSDVGLFGRPTLINNIETLYWVPDFLTKGHRWFTDEGRHGHTGLRAFSVSGRVKEPGVKLAPAGITMNELIAEYCGGMADGHTFRGYLPGGASGGILPATMADIPLDFGTLEKHGCLIGSAAIIVLSDQDSPRRAAYNIMRFFEDESCGQCTPCRVGTVKAMQLMHGKEWDIPLLKEISKCMMDASICGLGQAAPNVLLTALKYFPED